MLKPSCCVSDNSGDLVVGNLDFLDLIGPWDSCNACAADIDYSGTLDITGLLMMLTDWGLCPRV
ncbi:MAG: hypothetical protein HOO04_06435 [Phycisphaerae bacterium]|nr:hypothetical protein [Phycisphaerae bacterium]MBT5382865.1 hypothetical protein [Phycisphaerae bacterium]MBT5656458.1 hypothetical protein [Phycisphaerae bacterium]MDG2478065.1 hypothetical protein [Phycisphaerales bacterium]